MALQKNMDSAWFMKEEGSSRTATRSAGSKTAQLLETAAAAHTFDTALRVDWLEAHAEKHEVEEAAPFTVRKHRHVALHELLSQEKRAARASAASGMNVRGTRRRRGGSCSGGGGRG